MVAEAGLEPASTAYEAVKETTPLLRNIVAVVKPCWKLPAELFRLKWGFG